MNKRLFPPLSVLQEYVDRIGSVDTLDSPWNQSRCYLVGSNTRQMVLKSWYGHDEIARLKAEHRLLRKLRAAGFNKAAFPVRTRAGKTYVSVCADEAWSAYTYVGTRAITIPIDIQSLPPLLGSLLATLHRASPRAPKQTQTILSHLADLHDKLNHISGLDANDSCWLRQLLRSLVRHDLHPFVDLPRAWIHGDFNLANIRTNGIDDWLIDFEFCGFDLRALDLAPLIAPARNSDGMYQMLSIEVFDAIVCEYEKQISMVLPLLPQEKALMPAMPLLFYLVVLNDQLRANSVHVTAVVDLIRNLIPSSRLVFGRLWNVTAD